MRQIGCPELLGSKTPAKAWIQNSHPNSSNVKLRRGALALARFRRSPLLVVSQAGTKMHEEQTQRMLASADSDETWMVHEIWVCNPPSCTETSETKKTSFEIPSGWRGQKRCMITMVVLAHLFMHNRLIADFVPTLILRVVCNDNWVYFYLSQQHEIRNVSHRQEPSVTKTSKKIFIHLFPDKMAFITALFKRYKMGDAPDSDAAANTKEKDARQQQVGQHIILMKWSNTAPTPETQIIWNGMHKMIHVWTTAQIFVFLVTTRTTHRKQS